MKMLIAVTLLLAAAAVGCGSPGETSSSTAAEASGKTKAPAQEEKADPPETAQNASWTSLKRIAGSEAGSLLLPHGAAPESITTKDLRVGKGAVIQPEDMFIINYVSFSYETGAVLQNQWGKRSFEWQWGIDELVGALEDGLAGMRVGGLRELVVPGEEAYGAAAVYLVKLRSLEKQQ